MWQNKQGLVLDGASPLLVKNSFVANTQIGLQNNSTSPVDARNSWWGKVDGPRHSSNSDGEGDAVSDNVLFDPWLKEEFEEVTERDPGDVDGNGEIEVLDAVLILKFIVKLEEPSTVQSQAADVSGDGAIGIRDVILVLRFAVGQISGFSKPVLESVEPSQLDIHLSNMKRLPDGRLALTATFERLRDAVGGELLLIYDADFGQVEDIRIEGLSPEALSLVNSDLPGQVHVGFVEPKGSGEAESMRLSLVLAGGLAGESPQVEVSGQFYNGQGQLVGESSSGQRSSALPSAYALWPNYPNPFNPATSLRYDLPESGHVLLEVFSVTGQRVTRLVDGWVDAGHHRLKWDGRNDRGQGVASGVYLCRFVVGKGQYVGIRRMVFLK